MACVSRLRRIFIAKPSIKAATAAVVHHDDYETPQGLRNIVDNFKNSCQNNQFRRRAVIYNYTVRRLANVQAFSMIEEILEAQKQYKEISSEGFIIRLISLYGKAGMFDHARALFDEMPSFNCPRTVKSFSALLKAACTSKNFHLVHDLFRQIPSQCSIQPDTSLYNVVIHAFCEMGSTDSALAMFREMEELGLEPDIITFNTLLGGFYEKGGYDEGEKFWALMGARSNVAPDVVSYVLRMRGMILDGRIMETVKLVEEMREKGVEPHLRFFNVVIKGFCDNGKLEEAKHWYDVLVRCEFVADRSTYDTLVPFLCEKGDLDMAFQLCKAAISGRLLIDVEVLKRVVERFGAEGMIGEARELVGLAKKRKLAIDLPINSRGNNRDDNRDLLVTT